VEFGLFHEFPGAGHGAEAMAFARSFEQIDAAERWGLDAVWLAELHFSPHSLLSAPMVIASAVAARTRRIKIGTAVHVLPLCHPLRIAEEVATLDQVSQGRLIFGVGRSAFPRSYDAYGIPYSESRERFAEILEIVKLAWTQPQFSYQGAYYHFDNVTVQPSPHQRPYPPIRVAASSIDSYAAIGRLGHPILVACRAGTLTELVPLVRSYRDAYKAAGHDGSGEVYLRLPIYVAKTDAEARDDPEESIMQFLRYIADRFKDSASHAGARTIEQRGEQGQRLRTLTYDDALRDKVVVGTPEKVIDRLEALREQLGLAGLLTEVNSGGLIPHDRVMNAMKLLCEKVVPHFK
jgi:alkanesulfonate monooxygenase SsuD/methylene tetrahydromethanopterin reductase-like flavin-dependent oxidoreductase (luciferase family)